MKIIYAYIVTVSLAEQFSDTANIQHDQFPHAFDGVQSIVLTDEGPCILHGKDCFPVPGVIVGEDFCMARALNAAMDHAMREGADWLVLLDADAVLINPITQWPESGYGIVRKRQMEKDETFSPLPIEFSDSSYFILHESVFSKYRFCEDFIGYGYEDWDFMETLRKNGVERTASDARAFHRWHDIRHYRSRIDINKALYEKRTGLKQPQL